MRLFFFVTSSQAFAVANRALRIKRRTFSNELTAVLNEANSETGLSKEAFKEKKDYFEHNWNEIVTSTEDCVNLIDDGEEHRDDQIEELRYHIELLKL